MDLLDRPVEQQGLKGKGGKALVLKQGPGGGGEGGVEAGRDGEGVWYNQGGGDLEDQPFRTFFKHTAPFLGRGRKRTEPDQQKQAAYQTIFVGIGDHGTQRMRYRQARGQLLQGVDQPSYGISSRAENCSIAAARTAGLLSTHKNKYLYQVPIAEENLQPRPYWMRSILRAAVKEPALRRQK
ncbi:MAG: hypothetical protein BWY77_01396 [bacterium ADurb.Bin431]|nr:MAG: hypothetical protein BWY77_01396 [bacterium ADurb.Bin431]